MCIINKRKSMKTAVINIKVDETIKKAAQKLAKEMGLNLSAVINGYLSKFVREKRVEFNLNNEERPSDLFFKELKEAESEDEYSPVFTAGSEAISWLKNKNRKYENNIQKEIRKNSR